MLGRPLRKLHHLIAEKHKFADEMDEFVDAADIHSHVGIGDCRGPGILLILDDTAGQRRADDSLSNQNLADGAQVAPPL